MRNMFISCREAVQQKSTTQPTMDLVKQFQPFKWLLTVDEQMELEDWVALAVKTPGPDLLLISRAVGFRKARYAS